MRKTSFTGYNADGFTDKHEVLVNLCKRIHTKKGRFLQSNSSCDFNKKAYADFEKEELLCSRRINSKTAGADVDYEILIWNNSLNI